MKKTILSVPVRKPNRMSTHNYSEAGSYFLTACTYENVLLFGLTKGGCIALNPTGEAVSGWWKKLPGKFRNIELGDFVVMPNHFHGIVRIMEPGLKPDCLLVDGGLVNLRTEPSVPGIMQWFKTMSTNEFYRIRKSEGMAYPLKLWQRSYWDSIIRTEAEHNRISEYIKNNPARWIADRFYR